MSQQTSQECVDEKIINDLGTVKEKMDLCNKMLHPGDGSPAPSFKNNEALLCVIGFLEACGPRMVELVEAATQGALGEGILMECLAVNDRLLKLLADIDTYAFTETPATTTAATAPPNVLENNLNDLLLSDPEDKGKDSPEKKAVESDLFAEADELLSSIPDNEDFKMPAAHNKDNSKDEFDDFLAERTNGA
eukprot:CAMPEP_0194133074 /NCGR_PEP_ID=MMETSP0152-20130528/3379_1 /TAXON_ID=1049557 /ORGANISM="Thalassiothrix antarctica, Strain L6-D1" /LENGTH=191 /DNA_ID=CAMNT_0038828309 /DNA_START=75 /DNA_END=650 /DNA_ORIENTATION=-